MIAGAIGIVADQRVEAGAGHLARGLRDVVQAAEPRVAPRRRRCSRRSNRETASARARATYRGAARDDRPGAQRGQRLGDPLEQQLGFGVAALERRAGAVDALQRPGVPVRPAQLAADRRHAIRLGGRRAEELVEPGDAHLGVGLEPREQIAHPVDRGRRGVVVGAHRHRELRGGRPAGEHRPEPRPRFGQRTWIVHQARARLVAVRRQVMQQDRAAVGSVPAVEVAFLPGLAAEARARARRTRCRTRRRARARSAGWPNASGEYSTSVRPPSRSASARPSSRLRTSDSPDGIELVGEDIPRPDLQPTVAHEPRDSRALLGPDPEIVLEQDGLTVEEEAAKIRGGVEAVEQVVDGGDEAGHEGGAGKIPLPVPVGVRDEMDGEPGHRIGSQYSERRNALKAIRSATSARST